MPVFAVDGLPYIDAAWLERRIYRDWSRMQRWNQEAHRFSQGSDTAGRETCKAYLTQALHMSYRVEKWRRWLATTQAAIVGLQKDSRTVFGELIRERRTAASLSFMALGRLTELNDKTIANVERTGLFIARKTIDALLGAPALRLSWADVGLELLEENPADGRKHKRSRQPKRIPPTDER